MWWDRERPWSVLVAPLVAGAVMLAYFFLFDRWEHLENPIASQLAIAAALIGFGAAVAAQRITRWELVVIPVVLVAIAAIWAYTAPTDTAEDRNFRDTLWVLTGVLLVATLVLNLPQIVRGRYQRPEA